jgi:hypothetical protein
MSYSVKEIYYTLQGEGAHTGRPAVFLRFAGCNLWSGREQHRSEAQSDPDCQALVVEAARMITSLGQIIGLLEAPIEQDELDAARDYLIGVFPLRFETSGQVAGALSGLVIFGLPDDELDRYRPTIAEVSADAAQAAARKHIRPGQASIVVVGDVSKFESPLRDAGYGEVEIIHDEGFGRAED